MSLGRRIVQRAATRVFRRGIRVVVRKPDEETQSAAEITATDNVPIEGNGRQ